VGWHRVVFIQICWLFRKFVRLDIFRFIDKGKVYETIQTARG